MSPTARTALIRERFRKLYPSKVVVLPKAEKKPKIERKPAFGGIEAGWFGTASAWNQGRREWLFEPEKKKSPVALATKRIKRDSPLTVISRKLKRGVIIWQKYPQMQRT